MSNIKSCHIGYKALLVLCTKYKTDINGNSSYKITVLIKDKETNWKVISGVSNNYLRSLVTSNENCYIPKNIIVSFNITNTGKVIFTDIGEI